MDSERIVTRLRAEGYELSREHQGSDLVIVNTCGFLDSAKAESLAAIGNALKEYGKVIVTGCMGAEPESISSAYPDVSGDHRAAAIRDSGRGRPQGAPAETRPVSRSGAAGEASSSPRATTPI